MRPSKDATMPESFGLALEPNYLGSPAVVEKILAGFIREITGWIDARRSGAMTAPEMTAAVYERSKAFSAIFSGDDPAWVPVKGWNTRIGGLDSYLKIDLQHFWKEQHEAFDDDPFRVFFGWLVWSVADAVKLDDPDLVAMKMAGSIQDAVRELTGTNRRM
jgi:hypothetical protein